MSAEAENDKRKWGHLYWAGIWAMVLAIIVLLGIRFTGGSVLPIELPEESARCGDTLFGVVVALLSVIMVWEDATIGVVLICLFTMANLPNRTLCIAAAIMGYPNVEALKWGALGVLERIDDGLGLLVDPIVSYALAPMAKILVDWRIHPAYLYTDLLELLAIPVALLREFVASAIAA